MQYPYSSVDWRGLTSSKTSKELKDPWNNIEVLQSEITVDCSMSEISIIGMLSKNPVLLKFCTNGTNLIRLNPLKTGVVRH